MFPSASKQSPSTMSSGFSNHKIPNTVFVNRNYPLRAKQSHYSKWQSPIIQERSSIRGTVANGSTWTRPTYKNTFIIKTLPEFYPT